MTLFPIQQSRKLARESNIVPRAVYLAAYEVYCEVYAPQPAMIEGWCRGGFSIGELVAFLYARPFPRAEWKKRVNEAFLGLNI